MECARNEVKEVGGGGKQEGKFLGQSRALKNPWAGEENGFLVHPQNGLNDLIFKRCICGCWFTPAANSTFKTGKTGLFIVWADSKT